LSDAHIKLFYLTNVVILDCLIGTWIISDIIIIYRNYLVSNEMRGLILCAVNWKESWRKLVLRCCPDIFLEERPQKFQSG